MLKFFCVFTGTILKSVGPCLPAEEDNNDLEIEDLQYDGLEYLAGYICKRLQLEDSTYGLTTYICK